jgi:CheY-like chemotaxis protein
MPSANPAAATTRSLSILLADDSEVVRAVLSRLVASDPRFHLAAAAADGDEAVAQAEARRPDLAVLDVRMPGGGGVETCRRIKACSPNTIVMALSASNSRLRRRQMLAAGAVDYVVKGDTDADLLDVLWAISTR